MAAPSQRDGKTAPRAHVLLVPYPAQGHANPFLRLAKALHAHGSRVTFVHTEHNHGRLLRSRGPGAVAVPAGADGGFRFETIPDGLPPCELDATQDIWELCEDTRRTCPGPLRELVDRLGRAEGVPPVTCVVADGAMGFVVHVAKEMGLPAYLFFTPSACGFLGYLNFDQLVKRGYVPIKALDAIRARLPNTFTVGPLGPESSPPTHLSSVASSLWKQDSRCAAWLDSQAHNGSVVYVNFGSITVVTREQVAEFARGLAGSGSPFLWVVRPDMVRDGGAEMPLPEGFAEEVAAAGRGLTVGWCDQEAVLGHRATGGFLTHCGWNTTPESLRAGVPMLCWPFFAEQVTNCRYACEEWGVGVELPREAGSAEVEAAVRELMGRGGRAAAMRRKAAEWREMAARAVAPGGSSRANLERFVQEIARVRQAMRAPVCCSSLVDD